MMGKLTALLLGLAALSLMSVGLVIVLGALVRIARRVWSKRFPIAP